MNLLANNKYIEVAYCNNKMELFFVRNSDNIPITDIFPIGVVISD